MKKSTLFLIILLTTCVFLCVSPVCTQADFTSAQVKDISGRAYEPALIELLDGATESIVISMYNISLGTKTRNPVRLLLNDLLEARARNVSVTLYLNTRFRDVDKEKVRLIENPELKRLEDAGCVIHLMPANRRLHDKLIIVDSRYVVEGSTNWSISALRDNFESATLIDSPRLAKIKLLRLELLPVSTKPQIKQLPRPLYTENIAETIDIPKTLLEDRRYFSQMLTRQDERSMDLYLIVLAHSQAINEKEFFIDLESMGISLGMPDSWSDTALRRQVIKSLKKLRSNYDLIGVQFFYGKDAWIELMDIPGDSFSVSSGLIKPNLDTECSMRLKFLLMIKAFLKANGEKIDSMSTSELAKRFNVHWTTINSALCELRELEGSR
ncbi:MAG: hypothetical protein ISS45_05470 [Candidatus Omnitrophica bacterium]|nr:hypothetical protein [Candidatus Omnitrophota bacterium]